ncbi:type II toxin-antitoxin system HicB family antitoxin [Marinobacter nauticus]|uniref:type II toxin-antitoxin system HicB family antitoxin n=1 Tax=Marinobacter nauticus TaxID=2743 RepID=UPI000EB39A7A|nr:type II toxin-antitoxin system HicB family antitoxin [Marinobacter nauticus]RKR79587.1 putative HicB family RNase H-like nuclease [Marinobacter nauticus]
MSSKVLNYKGQIGSVDWDTETNCMYGQLMYINDLVTYEACSPAELQEEFEAAVDDYLETCSELGVEPNKPFKGSFNVRIGADLHKRIAFKAAEQDISINDAVTRAIAEYVEDDPQQKFLENVNDQIRKHVYQASLYASSVRTSNEPRTAGLSWSEEIFQGLKGNYSLGQGRAHEH